MNETGYCQKCHRSRSMWVPCYERDCLLKYTPNAPAASEDRRREDDNTPSVFPILPPDPTPASDPIPDSFSGGGGDFGGGGSSGDW